MPAAWPEINRPTVEESGGSGVRGVGDRDMKCPVAKQVCVIPVALVVLVLLRSYWCVFFVVSIVQYWLELTFAV